MNSAKKTYTILLIFTLILFCGATIFTRFNPLEIFFNSGVAVRFFTQDFFPPSINQPQSVFRATLTTVCLALSSTFIAGFMALAAAVFGSDSVSPFPHAAKFVRAVATFLRNIPPLVWAFILFSSLGIGTHVGFAALVISTFAFMTRAFIENIDEVSKDSAESLLVVGATFPQRVFQAIIPSCIQDFLSWYLYCIELNIRASTVVGMVGGGGIGMVLLFELKMFKYHTASGIILIIAASIILVDAVTRYLRRRLMEND